MADNSIPVIDRRRRQSSIELLRIIAMMMVLIVHADGASLGLPSPDSAWTAGQWWQTVIEALTILGVNLFVLISGYFLIKLTWRRLVNYIIMCGFYGVSIYALRCIVSPCYFTLDNTLETLRLFSGGDLWFIRDYFFLMLLSPLLNGGLKSLTTRRLGWVIAAMVLISCYYGWWWGGAVNPTGYNLMQMIMMYTIGYRLSRGLPRRIDAAAFYVASTIAIVIMATVMPSDKAYYYNSPAVILAAVSLFSLLAPLRFSSRAVNYVASSTFAVYLIHKNPWIWVPFYRQAIVNLSHYHSGLTFSLLCLVVVVATFVGCVIIDKVRYYLHIRW